MNFPTQLLKVSLSSTLFFAGVHMIVPELSAYLENLGGSHYKGLIMGFFFVGAAISRLLGGALADTAGRLPVMIIASAVGVTVAIFYPLTMTVAFFFVIRFIHGFSMGLFPIGATAYVADVVPEGRIGESMGILGLFNNLGVVIGFITGPLIASWFSTTAMFYVAGALSAGALLTLTRMRESLKVPHRHEKRWFRMKRNDFYVPELLNPAGVLILSSFCFGTILTIIPDMSDHLGFAHRGVFLFAFFLCNMLVRVTAGKLSDQYGQLKVFNIGSIISLAGMLMLANNDQSRALFMVSAVVLGAGLGICQPTLLAWTIKVSNKQALGKGLATIFMAIQIGSGLGAFVSGWIYANDMTRLPIVFYLCTVMLLVSMLYFVWLQTGVRQKADGQG
ncbi:MAG: MFS transporter [Bacteroidota bacterium]